MYWHLGYCMFIGPAFYFWASNAANFVAKVFAFLQFLQGSSGRVWLPVNFPMCPMFLLNYYPIRCYETWIR